MPLPPHEFPEPTGISPAQYIFPITPHDTAELPRVTKSIRVATAGDIAIETVGSEVTIIPDAQPGEWFNVQAIRVHATGTTASGITGFA